MSRDAEKKEKWRWLSGDQGLDHRPWMVEGSRELFFIVIFQVSVTDSGNSKDHTD